MNKTIAILAIIAAFVAGVLSANPVVEAAGGWEVAIADLQAQIDAIPAGQQGEQGPQGETGEQGPAGIIGSDDLPIEFVMLSTLRGTINPQIASGGILFYGDTLCRIEGSTSYLIKFGTQTTVEHENNSCLSAPGELISLVGASDAIFQKGDILVVKSDNGFFTEVFREQS